MEVGTAMVEVGIVRALITIHTHTHTHTHREEGDTWLQEEKLEVHTDWVRDVAWCPSVGLPINRVASCSQV